MSLHQASVKDWPLGAWAKSGVRTAPSAVLGHISGAKDKLQFLHYKAYVIHLWKAEQFSLQGRWGEEAELW